MFEDIPSALIPINEKKNGHFTVSIEADSISVSAKQLCERAGLAMRPGGMPYANMDNVQRVLNYFKNSLRYDEFHQKVFKSDGTEWSDKDTLRFSTLLQRDFGIHNINPSTIDHGINAWAQENISNEPLDWFNTLEWDGKRRISSFFPDYVGADNTEYAHSVSKNFWLSMVARIYRPGCQVDNMVVLEGKQGIYKSSLFETIGRDWYSCVVGNLDNKDFLESMRGKLIFEFAELHQLASHDVKYVKGMITSRVDRYRVAYGTRAKDYPRQLIICGTTNDHVYLLDDENRRQWPIKSNNKNIPIRKLEENRTQLFAEAVTLYKSEPDNRERTKSNWWQVPESAKIEQEARRQEDPWEPIIKAYIRDKNDVEIHTILIDCIKMDVSKIGRYDSIRVGKILKLYQWDRKQTYDAGHARWVYARPGIPYEEEIEEQITWED